MVQISWFGPLILSLYSRNGLGPVMLLHHNSGNMSLQSNSKYFFLFFIIQIFKFRPIKFWKRAVFPWLVIRVNLYMVTAYTHSTLIFGIRPQEFKNFLLASGNLLGFEKSITAIKGNGSAIWKPKVLVKRFTKMRFWLVHYFDVLLY